MKCHKRDSKTKAAFALEELKGKAVAHPCRSISTAKPSITNGARAVAGSRWQGP